MFLRSVFLTLISWAVLAPAICLAELPRLTVFISGADPAEGTVEVSVFNNAELFLKTPYMQQSGPVNENGEYATVFASLPEGEYAVVVVHDANENQKLDNGLFGFGGESYGYSNNVRPIFGRPDFSDASFNVTESTKIEIQLD